MNADSSGDFRDTLNSEFLEVLDAAAPENSYLWTTGFIGNPDGSNGWGGHSYDGMRESRNRVDRYGRLNSYFSTAALVPDEKGDVRRRKGNFARLLALVVDDIGADDLAASPSWVLNTSPGKQQVGFFLDADDPDCADQQLCTALITRMTEGAAGGDMSGNNTVRYVRLPQGQNQKPRPSGVFEVSLAQWNPQIRYTLDDAASAVGIDLDEIRKIAYMPAATTSTGGIHGEQDEKLEVAAQNIMEGHDLHDSVNCYAASMVASGLHPGALTSSLRGMMKASKAPKDERWKARYDDIPRAVRTAVDKFKQPSNVLTFDEETGEILNQELFKSADDIMENLKSAQYVIDGYLEKDALTLVFGPPGSGKSLVTLDMACSVVTGTPWHGAATKKGTVFIIIGEGFNGYARRLTAWVKKRGILLKGLPMFISCKAMRLTDEDSGKELSQVIDGMIIKHGQPQMILIDTLNRNFGDGDENSTKDMTTFINNVDTYIKNRYKANVTIVHHSGHDADRARGSSALKGAMDQEFSVSGTGGHVKLANTKMKDGDTPPDRMFKIESIELGVDSEGIEISGAVVDIDEEPLGFEVGRTKEGNKITASMILRALIDGVDGQPEMVIRFKCGTKTVQRMMVKMVKSNLVEKDGRWFKLSELGEEQARAFCLYDTL